jgi:uncharacterized protein (TIGR02246 family)
MPRTAGDRGRSIDIRRGDIVNILKSAAFLAAGLVALAACQPGAKNTAADESAIRDGTRAWVAAHTAGDADAVTALYSEDATVMPPGAPTATGHAAIRAFIESDIAAAKAAGVSLNLGDNDTVGKSGDLAWHSGSYTVVDASGATVGSGSYMEALQKKDGKWLIVRDIWNSDQAPAPAAEPPAAEDAATEAPAG